MVYYRPSADGAARDIYLEPNVPRLVGAMPLIHKRQAADGDGGGSHRKPPRARMAWKRRTRMGRGGRDRESAADRERICFARFHT